ncbi:Prolyl 4-hydroxylase subunit alpha-1 [Orchesella cincta]|uniref:Prolyl 4-hydroxylase subunit alpha-1 n=1 Tax=Orchesella cincta TaxID=48709 RepID=A0A1D2N5W0_ORCCI|nr:Prolyl 4-hydroxylase subunit alpha-1 [Orchesella cincta]
MTGHNIDRQIEDPENNVGYYTRNIAIQDANTESEKYWIRRKQALAHHFRGRISPEFGDINMWTLCTKENTQSESKKAKLKCYLDNQRHPRFYLKPLRVEVLSETPRVLQFHDIIGDKFVSRITEDLDASSKIMSGVGDLKVNDSIKASDYVKLAIFSRSSVNAWFDDDFYPELTRISETVTGLVTSTRLKNSSENFQAVEYVCMGNMGMYAVGRSYTLHVDVPTAHTPESFEDEENRGGARTATLLYYLNDVPKGGHTAFLNAEVAVPPKKGSAVYWENFFRNGTTRVDTWHASCPVLYGRKLVINKWFRSHLQFRTSPCSLNQLE